MPLDDAQPDADLTLEQTPLTPEAATPPARRRWRIIGAAGTLAVIAALGLLLASRGLVPGTGAPTPHPFVTQVSGWTYTTAFYVTSNLTAATVTVNGATYHGAMPMLIQPRIGGNTVAVASPFFPQPQTCAFTLSADLVISPTNACGSNVVQTFGNYQTKTQETDFTLPLTFTLNDLSSADHAAALRAIQQAAGTSSPETATVPTGDYYVTATTTQGIPTGAVATQPLQASYGTEWRYADIGPGQTVSHLSAPAISLPKGFPTTNNLYFTVPSDDRWTFTDGSGATAASVVDTSQWAYSAPVALHRTGNGFEATFEQELIAGPPDFPCPAARKALIALLTVPAFAALGDAQLLFDRGIQGCEVALTRQPSSSPATLPASLPRFIDRFGVLLAANAAAHALLPAIPVAPADEIAAVEMVA